MALPRFACGLASRRGAENADFSGVVAAVDLNQQFGRISKPGGLPMSYSENDLIRTRLAAKPPMRTGNASRRYRSRMALSFLIRPQQSVYDLFHAVTNRWIKDLHSPVVLRSVWPIPPGHRWSVTAGSGELRPAIRRSERRRSRGGAFVSFRAWWSWTIPPWTSATPARWD